MLGTSVNPSPAKVFVSISQSFEAGIEFSVN